MRTPITSLFRKTRFTSMALIVSLLAAASFSQAEPRELPTDVTRVPVVFSGGHETEGKRWFILANDSRRAEETTLQLSGIENVDVKPLNEDTEPLQIREGKASISMSPLGVAVYRLSP